MKKLFFLAAGVALSTLSFAQVSIGLQGIGNLSSAKFEMTGPAINPTKSMRAMPGGGVVVQVGFKKMALRTGVNFLQQGVKATSGLDGIDGATVQVATNINYLQVPVNLLYVAKLKSLQLNVGGGGYINYGVSGKSTVSGKFRGPNGLEDFKASDDLFKPTSASNDAFKRADFGLMAVAGIRLPGGIFANINYQFGLSNIDGSGDNMYKNRGLQLAIGYFFR